MNKGRKGITEAVVQQLESDKAELLEALDTCLQKLRSYAANDKDALGHGLGCFCDPDDFVRDEVELAQSLINKHRS